MSRRLYTLGMKSLPSEDLLPGHLIVLVVNLDYVLHVLLMNITLVPAPPGFKGISVIL